jgi:hypothetical protein
MESRRYRSLFWPVMIIGIGVLWLLGNMEIIQPVSLGGLLRFWPVLLIVAGLDMLIVRRSSWMGALMGLLVIGFIGFVLIAGPGLGWVQTATTKTERFSANIDQASAATVVLDLAEYPSEINTLSDDDLLFDAEIRHHGVVSLTDTGTTQRVLRLAYTPAPGTLFSFGMNEEWQIGLSPQIPLALNVDAGSGPATLNLTDLNLTHLGLDAGSGPFTLRLPAAADHYNLELDAGSGPVEMTVASEADITMTINCGSGPLTIDLPNDAAVRFEVREDGSGPVTTPNWLPQIQHGEDDEGVWETTGYASAAHRVLIIIEDQGSGPVIIK